MIRSILSDIPDKTFLPISTTDYEIFGDVRKPVTNCQVLPKENALKLLGTPEGVQKSYEAARKILVHRLIPLHFLPLCCKGPGKLNIACQFLFKLLNNALREVQSSFMYIEIHNCS